MNYQFLLKYSTNELKKNSIKNPSLDAEIMLSNILGISRENLLLNLEKNIKKEKLIKFNKDLEKRKKNKPIAYIIGKKEFWKTEFIINNSVLVPRPETELIVEEVKKRVEGGRVLVILDSDHSKKHVSKELELYAELVSTGSYMIVQDTDINGHPVRPNTGPGPMEAVEDFLEKNKTFKIDSSRERFLFTMHPKGYLQRLP